MAFSTSVCSKSGGNSYKSTLKYITQTSEYLLDVSPLPKSHVRALSSITTTSLFVISGGWEVFWPFNIPLPSAYSNTPSSIVSHYGWQHSQSALFSWSADWCWFQIAHHQDYSAYIPSDQAGWATVLEEQDEKRQEAQWRKAIRDIKNSSKPQNWLQEWARDLRYGILVQSSYAEIIWLILPSVHLQPLPHQFASSKFKIHRHSCMAKYSCIVLSFKTMWRNFGAALNI